MTTNNQELFYQSHYDYSVSPHRKHKKTNHSLVALLRGAMQDIDKTGLPRTLLEVGAGDGGFGETALAYGFRVTATEMSRPSIEVMKERFGPNPNFDVRFDEDGSLSSLGDAQFSIIMYASVLHHIPDYSSAMLSAISSHLETGGTFLSFQDPLWYPSLDRGTSVLKRVAHVSTRLFQGNYVRGLKTLGRRIRGKYDPNEPSDLVEYHVVRRGVDHERLVRELSEHFSTVELIPYWSAHSYFWQWVGERLGKRSTFAIVANGYHV